MERVLVVPPLVLPTIGPLVREAEKRGMRVVEAGAEVDAGAVHYYGGPKIGERVAARYGVGLLEPVDRWLPELPEEYRRRRIEAMTLENAWALEEKSFVKPPSDKGFDARVYADGDDLRRTTRDLRPDTPVLVSDVVEFAEEFRLFVLDGEVRAGCRYARWGHLDPQPSVPDQMRGLVKELAETLPSAVVVDVGLLEGNVAVVEANMAWFAQPYMADVGRVLEVVLRAAGPRAWVKARDLAFLR